MRFHWNMHACFHGNMRDHFIEVCDFIEICMIALKYAWSFHWNMRDFIEIAMRFHWNMRVHFIEICVISLKSAISAIEIWTEIKQYAIGSAASLKMLIKVWNKKSRLIYSKQALYLSCLSNYCWAKWRASWAM